MNTYLFKWEPAKTILAFTTLGGHMSGKLMKDIKNISPRTVAEMKLAPKNLGDVIFIDHYAFIVLRKHYNSKVIAKEFEAILNKLPKDKIYKTTKEDFSNLWDAISIPSNIEFYASSKWSNKR